MDLGAFSVMLWSFIQRENLYDIFEKVCGGRLTTSLTRVGGLAKDAPPDFSEIVRKEVLERFPPVLDEIEKMLSTNPIFLQRTQGVGVMTREEAGAYTLSGPVLRASGGA